MTGIVGQERREERTLSVHNHWRQMKKNIMLGAAAGVLLLFTMVLISIYSSASFSVNVDYVGNTEIQLSWQDRGSESFLRYELYRNDQNIHTAHDNASTTYQDFDVNEGLEYDYKVEAWYWDDEEEEEYIGHEGTAGTITTGDVRGTLIFDTGWTAADGPYNLTGDVIAGEGGELTINTGVTIYTNGRQLKGADPHIEQCNIYGGLIFEGVQGLSIIDNEFWMDPESYIQAGVRIYDCHDVLITGNEFHDYNPGAWPHQNPGVRFDLEDSSTACSDVDIYENTFTNCYYSIFGWKLMEARVYDNTFTDSYYGLWIDDELRDSEVRENTFDRVSREKSHALGMLVTGFNSTIHHNTFTDIGQGIQMRGEDSRCHENTMVDCTNGIHVWGTYLEVDLNNLDSAEENGFGIRVDGNRLTIHDNTLTEFMQGILGDGEVWDCVITKNQISKGEYGIRMDWDTKDNVTITDNHIHNGTEDGMYFRNVENFTVENNRILNHNWGNGINLHYGCYNNVFRDNSIHDLRGSGIYMGGDQAYGSNEHNTFEDNTLTDVGTGIELAGEWDVNSGYSPQDNNTFRRNTVTKSNHGIMLEGSSNNTFVNNGLHEIGTCGIQVWHYWDYYWKHSAYCYSNIFEGNVITTQNNFGWGIKDESIGSMGSQHKMVTMGNTYPTTLSIKDFNQTIEVRGVDLPPEMPGPPDVPSKQVNISNFVFVRYEGGPFELKFHYTDQQLGDLEEANIWLWRMAENETGVMVWDADRETLNWQRFPFHQPGLNEIYAQMENNSGSMTFAPLIGMPVHNLDTELDYNTIMDAIDAVETDNGHTIVVDPAYTDAGIVENIDIYKEITLISSDGGLDRNILRAENPDKDVVEINANSVTIRGFTIQGSTAQRGVYCRPDWLEIIIEECAFTANFNGIYYTGGNEETRGMERDDDVQGGRGVLGTRDDHGTIVIRNCEFKENLNADVILNTTLDCTVEDSAFNGGQHGLALQFSEYTRVSGCTFTGYELMAIYILEGGSNSFVGNDIYESEVGLRLHTTTENDISNTKITNTVTGYELIMSDNNLLENNTISGTCGFGVKLDSSDSNIIRGFDISLTGEWLTGVQLEASGDNSLFDLNIHNFNTVGYGATGIRVFAGSSRNVVNNSVISTVESSNSTGLVTGSPLNTFNQLEITSIISYGNGPCYGIHVLPFANSNLFASVEVLTVTGNEKTAGIYLDSNNDNNITNCVVEGVTSNYSVGVGVRFNNCPSGFVLSSEIKSADVGILCEAGSNPVLHWNNIIANSEFGVQNTDASVIIHAENNFWGHISGPAGAGPGTGDKVSEYVDFEPWTGAQAVGRHEETVQGTGTMDSIEQSDTEVVYDTDSEITITTQSYITNPGVQFNGDIGKYIDVHLDSSEGVNEIEIRLYYTEAELGDVDEDTLRMYWWTGEAWRRCSATGVNTEDTGDYAGYIWARISSDGSPTLSEMTGTPFLGGEDEETDPSDGDDDDGIGTGLILGIVVVIVIVLLVILVQMGIIPLVGSDNKKGRIEEVSGEKESGIDARIGVLGKGSQKGINGKETGKGTGENKTKKGTNGKETGKGTGAQKTEKGTSVKETESNDQ